MPKKRPIRILAIDPGTRKMGVAVLEGRELLDCRVKILKTKGSPKRRLEEARKIIQRLLEDYKPLVLVLEKPFFFWSKQSALLTLVTEEIKSLARRNKIKVHEYSPRTVRKAVSGDGNATKRQMAEALTRIFPDLYVYLNHDRKWKELYWGHMFDAVGLGLCCLYQIGEN